MKKLLLLSIIELTSLNSWAQCSNTIAVQFYIDANNNCAYNTGEQLVYNPKFTLHYVTTGNSTLQTSGNFSFTSCGGSTICLFNPSVTTTNTLVLGANAGIIPNLSCNNYTNIPFNTNSTI